MPSKRELTSPKDRVHWAIEQMKLNGMGLQELATQIGCTHATLSQWQTGETNIANAKVGLIDKFCEVTGISMNWLLHGGSTAVDSYTPSDRIAGLTRKLIAMENQDPATLAVVAKMIDAASPDSPEAPTPQ